MSCAKKAEYSDTCELNLRDNRKKTLIDQNIEGGVLSLSSLAAKLMEGLKPRCLPMFTLMLLHSYKSTHACRGCFRYLFRNIDCVLTVFSLFAYNCSWLLLQATVTAAVRTPEATVVEATVVIQVITRQD